MNIGVKDVVWNYLATFLKIGSSIILLPLILKYLSSFTDTFFLDAESFPALKVKEELKKIFFQVIFCKGIKILRYNRRKYYCHHQNTK